MSGLSPNAVSKAVVMNFGAPTPLALLGFPGCSFLVDPALSVGLGAGDVLSIAVPNSSGNYGLPFFIQAVGIEFLPVPTIALSDRGDAVVGVR